MNTGKLSPESEAQNCCSAREHSAQVLRGQARRMRTEAIEIENLADQIEHLRGTAEEALFRILVAPRR